MAWWKIFEKAGRPGCQSIIPFYDGHVLFGICWEPLYFWLTLLFGGGAVVIQEIYLESQTNPNILISVLVVAMATVAIVLHVKLNLRLAKAFGKGTGFTIGLMVFHTIFSLILGFGKTEYVGNRGIEHDSTMTK